jgi:tetratricopeptide (TPR) repeat protein
MELAWALVSKGDKQRAMNQYRKIISINSNPEAANNLGVLHYEQGNLLEAERYYGKALAVRPDYINARDNMIAVKMELGKYAEAVRHLKVSLRIRPNNARGHFDLSIALTRMGNTREAAPHYRTAVRSKPGLARAWPAGVPIPGTGGE